MQATKNEDVRYCNSCHQTVHRVVDVEGFELAVAQGRCVMAQGCNSVDGTSLFVVGMADATPYELGSSKLAWEE